MTITYRNLVSTLLLVAVTLSAAFQLYRASLDTPYAVDRFGLSAGIAYAVLFGVALLVRIDRRWMWWTVGILLLANLGYGVAGYYPGVYAARPLGVLDWLEGTLYTGLLLAALGCTVLQLTGTALGPARGTDEPAPPAGQHLARGATTAL